MENYSTLTGQGQVLVADAEIISEICRTWLAKTDHRSKLIYNNARTVTDNL